MNDDRPIRELQAARVIKTRTGKTSKPIQRSVASQRPGEHIIGDRLREARKARGMTQSELARAGGYSTSMISRYEIGDLRATRWTIKYIAEILGVNQWYLTGDSEVMECEQSAQDADRCPHEP